MFLQRQFTPDPLWVEQIKPNVPTQDATPRTTCASPMSRTSMHSSISSSSFFYDDLGDAGSFEKLFDEIPEHLCLHEVNFFDNQLDWSQEGVHSVFKDKIHAPLSEEMIIDWSVHRLPRYKPDFWELQRDWSQPGVPIKKEMPEETIIDWGAEGMPQQFKCPTDITVDWSNTAIPHQFKVGTRPINKMGEELMVNWSKRGVPVKNSWWYNPIVDWSQDALPEIWENATPKESKLMSFMPGPFSWSRPSFWEEPMVDWSKNSMPKIFRKVCEKPSAHRDIPIDWSVRGLPIAFRKSQSQAERPIICDWSAPGVPIENFFIEDRGLNWNAPGIPTPFNIGSRYPELPSCDWSASGLPHQMQRAYASDDDIIIDWSRVGMSKEFKASPWDNLALDWSGASIPKQMRFKDRFNHVYAKSVQNFFKPPPPKDQIQEAELGIDWIPSGIPKEFLGKKPQPTESEEICLDWSYRLPPSQFRHDPWYSLAINWSAEGLPQLVEKPTKWNPLIIDWSDHGEPQQFRMAPTRFWQQTSINWSEQGMNHIFNTTVPSEDFKTIDFSVPGIPNEFKYMGTREKELCIDWLSRGLPAQFKFWNEPCLDWSEEGLPRLFSAKGPRQLIRREEEKIAAFMTQNGYTKGINCARTFYRDGLAFGHYPLHRAVRNNNLDVVKLLIKKRADQTVKDTMGRNPLQYAREVGAHEAAKILNQSFPHLGEELVIDWSKKGIPKPFHTTKWDFFTIDWSENGLLSFSQLPGARLSKAEQYYKGLDWSLTGLAPSSKNVKPQRKEPKGWVINWCTEGVPDFCKRADPPKMLDWSARGIPYQISCAEYETLYALDWTTKGLPAELQETYLDVPYMDWSAPGIPHVFNAKPEKVSCRICRLNPTPYPDYIFDWSASGLPLKTTFWDYPIFDWHTKGVPIAGEPMSFTFDWSSEGVPFLPQPSDTFESDPLRMLQPSEKRTITQTHEKLALEGKDLHFLTTIREFKEKPDWDRVFSPFRLTERRREARWMEHARKSRERRFAMRWLRHFQKVTNKKLELKSRKKRLTMKRENQRVDKRMRRGDTPYDGVDFVDDYPVTSFFDDWPHAAIARIHEEMEQEKPVSMRASKRISRASKQHDFDDWPHEAVARIHQVDVDLMKNKYLFLALFQ